MEALPATSRTLCHGHRDCRVCLGLLLTSLMLLVASPACGQHRASGKRWEHCREGEGISSHSQVAGDGQGLCLCSHPLGFCLDL